MWTCDQNSKSVWSQEDLNTGKRKKKKHFQERENIKNWSGLVP